MWRVAYVAAVVACIPLLCNTSEEKPQDVFFASVASFATRERPTNIKKTMQFGSKFPVKTLSVIAVTHMGQTSQELLLFTSTNKEVPPMLYVLWEGEEAYELYELPVIQHFHEENVPTNIPQLAKQ